MEFQTTVKMSEGGLQTWTQNTLQDNSEEKKVLHWSEKRGGQGCLLLFSERNAGWINFKKLRKMVTQVAERGQKE